MKDLTSPGMIKLKGILFLVVGLLSAALLLLENLTLKMAVLFVISVWCFCRFYYFAFYVIEKYVDPGYRFSGLWSFALYLIGRRSQEKR
jgi:Na+/glutamate symporter